MSRVRSLALMISLVTATAVLFGAGGYFGANLLIDRQNQGQLRGLTESAIGRAERHADFAFIALADLAAAGMVGCDLESLVHMRQQVYMRSTVKDIRVVDAAGRTLCAAFPETLDYDASVADLSEAAEARNTRVSLFKLDQRSTAALGVLWRVESDFSLVAVLNTDALLFDILPAELRDASRLQLVLSTGDVVASFTPTSTEAVADGAIANDAGSARYPMLARLEVDRATLASWNKGPEVYVFLGAAGLGLAFGYLLCRALAPRHTFLSEIDAALASGAFRPFAQPVFSLKTGAITGCEILARWIREDGTVVPPYRFIPIAEETGRIVPLTRALMREALDGLRPMLSTRPDFAVAFNISPRDFLAAGFVADMVALAAKAAVAPGHLVLEITERQQLPDLEIGAATIRQLAAHGIRVAIDDAGTGHNGLSQVQGLSVQVLKIDKFFVDAIESEFSARVIVEMLVSAARRLGMTTIAEGIERPGQLQWLRDIGVDEGQGFIVSPAVPLPDLVWLVEAERSSPAGIPAGLSALVA